jgi:hypothetical protein
MKAKLSASAQFQFKTKYQRKALSCPSLSMRAKLLLVALLDHLNCNTGRCNPTREVLRHDVGAKCLDTIKRGLAELERKTWITRKFTRGAPWYSFPLDRLKDGGADLLPLNEQDGGADQPGWGCRSARMGVQPSHHGIEKNRELIEGEASPSPCNGRASASRESQPAIEQEKAPTRAEPNGKDPDPPRAPQAERERHAAEALRRLRLGQRP